VEKTRLKTALAASARVSIVDHWDSPFRDVAAGFTVPLVAAGELYGVFDVGYPLGCAASEEDEQLLLPFVNHLSVALRNERLHRETSLLRDYQSTLIEQADALIIGVDTEWRITVCNQALCRLSGYERDEIVGSDLRDWMIERDRPRVARVVRQAFAHGGAEAVDIELVTRSGKLVKTVWSIARVAVRGDLHAVVAVGQDQTRLAELQNQVIQAEKLATLGQLAAGVVHELNNPLTSITVYADYLRKKLERCGDHPLAGAGDQEKLQRIGDAAQRILLFAKDLVQYAKPSGDAPEPIEVRGVVKQSLSFCEHLFERGGIERVERLSGEGVLIHAIPGQLEQVVINLVTNACHAVGEGGQVIVEVEAAAEDGVWVVVSDDGPGIPAPKRDQIFEPFFSTKSDGHGTGLGLSIVKNIVEQHQGEIRVDASPAGGARFSVWLPSSRL
jgi:two-component system, NtrC family, sensor kinase